VGPESQGRALRLIVCDTGPLLHLQEASSLDLLSAAGRIVIPSAVRAELNDYDPLWNESRARWITVESLEPENARRANRWVQADLLHEGEAEALSLAIQMRADWLLTDDAAARLVAQQQGLEVHGSLGVVLWAAATGHLQQPEAESRLEALSRTTLWMSSRVLEEARAALRQILS
jgi:predicted nucleic acid-binding protein